MSSAGSARAVSTEVSARTVVIVTSDADLRRRLAEHLEGLRWNVQMAGGGAEAMAILQDVAPEAMLVDHWLPDLDVAEFADYVVAQSPRTDLLQMDGTASPDGARSARRNELLHALREVQDDFPAPGASHASGSIRHANEVLNVAADVPIDAPPIAAEAMAWDAPAVCMHLPEMVGDSPGMRELAQMVRLVAGHRASVLIQGETGTGKELVAKAVHRLSTRASKPFAVLNCAAIPEHLLEAELFGHTRGAFTGAVTSRTGRIEAAHGGTLFLDEIGEMPMALQAKMLRFLESGEIQRVGDNDMSRVDVRIVAATHQPLEKNAEERLFRLDLYFRLAVFPLDVPALRERMEDVPMLTEYLLRKFGEDAPRCSIHPAALDALMRYHWPGNVRQLGHALQRACILAGATQRIEPKHLKFAVN